jgi:hypothetical protein
MTPSSTLNKGDKGVKSLEPFPLPARSLVTLHKRAILDFSNLDNSFVNCVVNNDRREDEGRLRLLAFPVLPEAEDLCGRSDILPFDSGLYGERNGEFLN